MNSKITRIAVSAICLTLLISGSFAQRATPAASSTAAPDRVALYQALLDLTNPWTVMCIAAHPDDEDGTSLIVMRHKYGAHTVSLFSTFGEGGQNAIGPELYEELGAIRARETMAAAEIQGSEPHFLGLKDFGYSKSADEAFRVWGHDEALRRMVLQIRKLRPDVIITNHSATSNDHGHHQATARLELEAFDAAADPQRFPEQLKDGVTVWQVQRLFVRAGRSSQTRDDDASIVTLDPNERDPVRETTFAEEALRALHQHATQGPWPKTVAEMARFRNSADGKLPLIRYRLARYAKDSGIAAIPAALALGPDPHNFLDGLKLPESFAKELEMPMIDGKPLVDFAGDRSKVLEQLLQYMGKGFRLTSDWTNSGRLSWMRERITQATAIAAGLSLEIETPSRIVTPNSSVELGLRLLNGGPRSLSVYNCSSEFPSLQEPNPSGKVAAGPTSILSTQTTLNGGSTLNKNIQLHIPLKAIINLPLSRHLYETTGLGLQATTRCSVGVGPASTDQFTLQAVNNFDVSSPVEIGNIQPAVLVITPQTKTTSLRLPVTNHENGEFRTTLETILAHKERQVIRTRVAATPLTLAPNETREVVTEQPVERKTEEVLFPPESAAGRSKRAPTPRAAGAASPLPPATSLIFRTSNNTSNEVTVPIVFADARVAPNVVVGYVRGFDFSLPNALAALGVESKELSSDEVRTAGLQKYSSIIVDNRVYESKPELIAANQKLLDYAKDGGTLIVFYHKSNEWNPDERRKRPQLAPYKLVLGDERITDETAPITFIEPDHPLLNVPNKMGQDDFANWIQERGLYYPREWDPQFHALLQSNDPGEAPLKGGLLVADYGRGHYIYTSMVWYRELRAGVPGAYRMLANMISYGRPPR